MFSQRALLSVVIWLTVGSGIEAPFTLQTPTTYSTNDVKVPVVLGVMSQCPDAILCESVFNRALEHVSDKIDLSLTFIGKYAFI